MNRKLYVISWLVALAMIVPTIMTACWMKPVIKTVADVAHDLCVIAYAEKHSLSVEDAAKAFCNTEAEVHPFLDELLSAKQRATQQVAAKPSGSAMVTTLGAGGGAR